MSSQKQLTLFDDEGSVAGCSECLCRDCMLWWSSRCPHGECWDDYRARVNPYDKAHPDKPPRTFWSDWEGDQAAWCRGGSFYAAHACGSFVGYTGSRVEDCLRGCVQVFQDGYRRCVILETGGSCEDCWRVWEGQQEKEDQ